MKKHLSITLGFLFIGSLLSAQTLDEVLTKYFDANGQDKMVKVNTMKITGKLVQGGMDIPFIQMFARPANIRVEATLQGISYIQTYDGKEGWTVNPFTGVTDPQPFSEDELKSMKYQADMDGMLWNWKEKGYTVTLEGEEEVEGTNCYKVKIVTPDGDLFTQFIDADSYIQIQTHSKVKVQGNETEADTFYSNYLMVNGIAIPGKIVTKMNGQVVNTIVSDTVEIDVNLDKALFSKPVK
jgi:hypothetical protein